MILDRKNAEHRKFANESGQARAKEFADAIRSAIDSDLTLPDEYVSALALAMTGDIWTSGLNPVGEITVTAQVYDHPAGDAPPEGHAWNLVIAANSIAEDAFATVFLPLPVGGEQ